jgi:preprotein translocase subunit SecD
MENPSMLDPAMDRPSQSLVLGELILLRRLKWKSLVVIIAIVGLAIATMVFPQLDLRVGGATFQRGSDEFLGLTLGLDLAGGTLLIYQAGRENEPTSEEQMEGLIKIISKRVDSLGVSEPNIQRLGDDRLLIQLPGIEDPERAKSLIGQTARLDIVQRECLTPRCSITGGAIGGNEFKDYPFLTGDDIKMASAGQDGVTGEPVVLFEMTSGAARQFAEVTQEIFESNSTDTPDQLAFVLDGGVIVSAGVISPILSGSGQISGRFGPEEARNLAIQIESGRLPVDISVLTERVVTASLGTRSLKESLIAGLVGLAMVLFFMVAYYRASGLVAGITLVCYTAMVLAIFKLIPVTVTLAGVAGFILSLGMAVDANILIFERMKEELRIGRTLQFALQIGFNRAWSSIRDGNISTLIIATVLFFFGQQTANSAVTGFSVALGIGVLISMFTAIFIARNLMWVMAISPFQKWPRLFSPESIPLRKVETSALSSSSRKEPK